MEQYDWLQNGSSLVGVYIANKNSLVENFKHGRKPDIVANMATFLARTFLWRSSFVGNPEPLDKKLGPRGTPTRGISLFVCPPCL